MIPTPRRTSALLLFAIAASLALAVRCIPPPPIGLVVHGPQRKGTVIVSGQGGGGGSVHDSENDIATGAGGVVHVEPFVTERLSVPISLGVGRLRDTWFSNYYEDVHVRIDWYGTLRVGARYRVASYATLGGGLGAGAHWGDNHVSTDDGRKSRSDGNATLDFEWSLGRRWRSVALSFSQRLVWDLRWLAVFHLLSDFTVAYFPLGGRVALTASGFFGLSVITVWTGGCGGILVMF